MKFFGSVVIHSSLECYVEAETKEEAEQKMIDFAQEHEYLAETYEVETGTVSVWDEKTMGKLEGRCDVHNADDFDDEEMFDDDPESTGA